MGVLGGLLLALVLSFGLAGYQVYAFASVRADASADVAIVLGAAVWDGRPSPVFEERIKHGVELYRQGRVDALVFTGGVGEGDQLAEAEVARLYALARGVPEERIYCETQSRVTYHNLKGAQTVLAREGLTTALLVSDPLHMRRATRMAQDLGMQVYPSPTPTSRYRTWRSKFGFLMSESRLYGIYLLRRLFKIGL